MSASTIAPVAQQERIQTIDIIRGIALLGILIINFTVDSSGINQKSGFGDQFVYWTVKLFMDDRFQSTYCFLFGLGFAIQMQRAAARNSPFVFAHLRRMISLYIIMIGIHILTNEAYNVLPYYAMVGVLLLLFWKVPIKFLPFLAILFFFLPWTRNTIVNLKTKKKIEEVSRQEAILDTTALDKFIGVYENPQKDLIIIIRKGKELYGKGPNNNIRMFPISDTSFALEARTAKTYFVKDSADNFIKFILRDNGKDLFTANKIALSIEEGLKEQEERKTSLNNKQQRPSYSEFVKKNATNTWNRIKNWSWQNFIWNNYKVGYILVLFLLGLYAGKRKIFYEVDANRGLLSKVFKWGMIVGGAGILIGLGFEAWNFIYNIKWNSYSIMTRAFMDLLWDIGKVVMALGYIAGLTLLLENSVWKKRLSFFATVGRMGFTAYILHLFAYVIIFDKVSWFLGLDDKTGCFYRLLLAIPVYVILYFTSKWWLRYFKQGPFEWLWRSLTYLKFQPMRLKQSSHS